jgi:hypothetical protein
MVPGTRNVSKLRLAIMRLLYLLFATTLLSSCAATLSNEALTEQERVAACRAQEYLRINGYLDAPASEDRSRITLELWDRMNYEKDGVFNWDQLLADRRGAFSNRLHGLKSNQSDFLVVYKMDKVFACIRVDPNSVQDAHKNEANCYPKRSALRRTSERSLVCSTAS